MGATSPSEREAAARLAHECRAPAPAGPPEDAPATAVATAVATGSTPDGRDRPRPHRSRIVGIDAARGIGLLLIVAAHVLVFSTPEGAPTSAYVLGSLGVGLFVFVTGVGVGLATGGPTPPTGIRHAAAVVTLSVRAVAIAGLGLLLGYLVDYDQHAVVVLVTYGLLFLLAIPLLRLGARRAAVTAAVLSVAVPVLSLLLWNLLPAPRQVNPTFGDVLSDPWGWAVEVSVKGVYPALAWTALLCAGLAVGRLRDLASRRVAAGLLMGGVALVALTRALSWLVLQPLGGLERVEAALAEADPATVDAGVLWGPDLADSRPSAWWLATDTPYSATPVELLQIAGLSAAGLGLLLLLGSALSPLLRPLATVGAMTLTLYTGHLLLLSQAGLPWGELSTLVVHLVLLTGFAVLWRQAYGRGPLEAALITAGDRVRAAVLVHHGTRRIPAAPGAAPAADDRTEQAGATG